MPQKKSDTESKKEEKVLTTGDFMKKLDLDYGAGTAMLLSNLSPISRWASSGLFALDDAMGWGLPGGRIVEWFGAESSGKTSQLMAAFIENSRKGGDNAVFDPEGTFNQDRYVQTGGDPSRILVIEPGTAETYYDKLKLTLQWAKGRPGFVIIGLDTMAMLIPRRVLEAEGDDEPVAELARINSRHLPGIQDTLKHTPNVCLLILNQVRDKVGASAWGSADANIDTPGGRIIKHISSVRVFFNKVGQIDNQKSGDARVILGAKGEAKVVKNKVGPPLRKVPFRIMFDERGVDNLHSFAQTLVAKKALKYNKGIYTFKSAQGEVALRFEELADFLLKRPKLTAALLDKAYELEQTSIGLEKYVGKSAPIEKE